MSTRISIAGHDKAEILAALYNRARPPGFGFLPHAPEPMTATAAAALIAERGLDYDYLKGRVMKVTLAGDDFDPWLYDRDNGHGAAESALMGILTRPVAAKAG